MKIITGIKMFDIEDITVHCGARTPMCTYIKSLYKSNFKFDEGISNGQKLEIDTRIGDSQKLNMMKPFKFLFIPLPVAEERLIAHSIITTMEFLKSVIADSSQHRRFEEMVDKHEMIYDKVAERYKTFESIYHSPCIMILLSDDKVEDVTMCHPGNIIDNIINKGIEYTCESCGKITIVDGKSIDEFFPDEMKYEVVDNKIMYYCPSCTKKNSRIKKLKFIGQ